MPGRLSQSWAVLVTAKDLRTLNEPMKKHPGMARGEPGHDGAGTKGPVRVADARKAVAR